MMATTLQEQPDAGAGGIIDNNSWAAGDDNSLSRRKSRSLSSSLSTLTNSWRMNNNNKKNGGVVLDERHLPLQGREMETEDLTSVLHRVVGNSETARSSAYFGGRAELVWLDGPSGSGKTRLAEEILRPSIGDTTTTTTSGATDPYWFVSVKFEQPFEQNYFKIPVVGLTTAFSDLMDLVVQQSPDLEDGKSAKAFRDSLLEHMLPADRRLLGQLVSHLSTFVGSGSSDSDGDEEGFEDVVMKEEDLAEAERAEEEDVLLAELSDRQSFERFQRACKSFLRAIAAVQPLVILLDDLQWSDPSSTAVLSSLTSSNDLHRILLVGTYRPSSLYEATGSKQDGDEDEVLTLPDSSKLRVTRITLNNLDLESVESLIRVCLPNLEQEARRSEAGDDFIPELARIVKKKTSGNPYFCLQYLRALQDEGLLPFPDGSSSPAVSRRSSTLLSLDRIQEQTNVSSNVVALLQSQIENRVRPSVRRVLNTAAHLGFYFRKDLLVAVLAGGNNMDDIENTGTLSSGSLLEDTILENALTMAIQEGYLELLSSPAIKSSSTQGYDYKFAHDAIQQSFYQGNHAKIHHLIARVIEARFMMPPKEGATTEGIELTNSTREAWLFTLTDHWNRASSALETQEERLAVARINLEASNLARQKSALFASVEYLREGCKVLNVDSSLYLWRKDYNFALELTSSATVIEYCCGNFDQCKELIDVVLAKGQCEKDKLTAYEVQVEVMGAESKFDLAVESGIHTIRQLGDPFPPVPNTARLLWYFQRTRSMLSTITSDEQFLSLPELDRERRPAIASTIKILGLLSMYGVWIHDIPLISIAAMRMMQLTVKYGKSSLSPYAFAMYSSILIMTPRYKDEAVRFANLALRMVETLSNKEAEARTIMIAYSCTLHNTMPLPSVARAFLRSTESGLLTGDIENALTGAAMRAAALLCASGKDCPSIAEELEHLSYRISSDYKHEHLFRIVRPFWQMAENLMGQSENTTVLTGDAMDEALMFQQGSDNPLLLQYCRLCKLQLAVYFNQMETCGPLIEEITQGENMFKQTFNYAFFKFFAGLASYVMFEKSKRDRKARKMAKKCLKVLEDMKEAQNANVVPLVRFLHAEEALANVRGKNGMVLGQQDTKDMEGFYLAAIDACDQAAYMNIQALACERLVQLLKKQRMMDDKVSEWMEVAVQCYEDFGADAKAVALKGIE